MTSYNKDIVLGDVQFADDTTLFGEVEEMGDADRILKNTMEDWEEKANDKKIIQCAPLSP